MNKAQVIEFYEEAGKPLEQHSIDIIEENLDYSCFTAKCRICNHQEVVIVPSVCDLDNLECGNCGNMTLQPALPDDEMEEYQMQDNFNKNRFFVS